MPEPVRFSPEQLDRIEDALETLEEDGTLGDPTPDVRGVLESYREILQQSRYAMPMVDPPQGVLAAVFAEARAVAVAPAPTAAPEPTKPSVFTRFRRSFLIPVFALAGTAALVLWVSRPHDGAATLDPGVAAGRGPSAPAQPAAASRNKQEAIAAPAKVDEAPEAEPVDERSSEAEETVKDGTNPAARSPAPDAPTSAPKAGNRLTELNAADTLSDKERSKDPWGRLERADRARESGDCAAAHSDYLIATEDDIPGVRARAYAGLGLCNLQAGDDAGSEDAFARARGIDPAIDKFIATQREPSGRYRRAPSSKRRPKHKKSAKPAAKSKNADRKNSAPSSPLAP